MEPYLESPSAKILYRNRAGLGLANRANMANTIALAQGIFASCGTALSTGILDDLDLHNRRGDGFQSTPVISNTNFLSPSMTTWSDDGMAEQGHTESLTDQPYTEHCMAKKDEETVAPPDVWTLNTADHMHVYTALCIKCAMTDEDKKRLMSDRRREQNRSSQRRFRQRKADKLADATEQVSALKEQVQNLRESVERLQNLNYDLQAKLNEAISSQNHLCPERTPLIAIAEASQPPQDSLQALVTVSRFHNREPLFLLDHPLLFE